MLLDGILGGKGGGELETDERVLPMAAAWGEDDGISGFALAFQAFWIFHSSEEMRIRVRKGIFT